VNAHRLLQDTIDDVQRENRKWWTTSPMTYDWRGTLSAAPLSTSWFAEIDDRWIRASYPYLSKRRPFDRIMPDSLTGKRVLEIGCGMGLHTQQLAERGAVVTAIDLTDPAVEATRLRLNLAGLAGRVQQSDAEALPFEDEEFDLVWSWGVIHHSSRTARIIREIARVLDREGETRLMVYNRDSRIARITLARHWLGERWRKGRTSDEILWAHTDGFMARHYTVDGFNDLLAGFFEQSTTQILGQESDVIPLPWRLRKYVIRRLSDSKKQALAARHGAFLFSIATRPIRS
jgi:2-polyprenyl-3-methyl-5-hydroxy-6-metoxy-1,4-benzoquinol methylase